MPPSVAGPYFNTYKTYKTGTVKITSWLVENAILAGLPKDSSLLRGLPGTLVEKDPQGTTYPIALKSFTAIATVIASSPAPKIELPTSIASLIRGVINLRKQANAFFAKYSKGAETASDQGHLHFVEILEQASSKDEPEDATASVTNLFKLLTVEEPTAVDVDPAAAAPAKKKKKSPEKHDSYTYQPDRYNIEAEALFALFSFFHDINQIRNYVRSLWKDYHIGKIDLSTAAVTSDTALMMLRRTISDELPESLVGDLTYPQISMIFNKYLNKLGGASEDFSDWICIRAANVLNSYEDVLQDGQIPVLKPGHFGVYDPTCDRSKLSDEKKYREDLIVLMELLPEFTTLSRTKMHVPAEDELTTGLRKMMDTNSIEQLPMYAIFGTQILLDIHHELREDISRPFEQFQAAAKTAIATLTDYFNYSRNRNIVNWPAQNDENLRGVMAFAKDWALTDRLAKAKHVIMKNLPVEPEPFKLLRCHPILAGLMTFRLKSQVSESGILLCNAWGSVLYPAHLYNAAQKSGGLDSNWEDMEYVLSAHSPARIFVGTTPSDSQEYWKRFALALGTSASAFARNRRTGDSERLPESKKGPRGLKTTSPVRDIFRDRYCVGSPAVLTTANINAMLAVATKAQRTSQPSLDLVAFTRQTAAQAQLSPLQLLTAVREGLAGEELHLAFDYFGLHQRGYELLRTLQTHLQGDLARYFGPEYIENESELPFIVGYIFEVARGSDRIAEEMRVTASGSRMLHRAAEVMGQYLEQDGNGSKGIVAAKAGTAALQ